MAFVRYYASLLNGNGVSSAVGANWMHNFDMKLAVENDRATVTLFRGKQVPFRRAGNAWDLVVAEQVSIINWLTMAMDSSFTTPE